MPHTSRFPTPNTARSPSAARELGPTSCARSRWPMSSADCEAMILACDENDVKLMIAYRLHFEAATLRAIELARSGELGELRFFSSSFGHRVKPGGIRARPELGG